MCYISAERRGDTVVVWERSNPDTRTVRTFKTPYYFYTDSEAGEYRNLYGGKVTKHEFTNANDFNNALDKMKVFGHKTYESDINVIDKVLSNNYHGAQIPKLNTTFFDIEVDYDRDIGYSTIQNPYAPINAISLYHTITNKYVVLAVPPNYSKAKSRYLGKKYSEGVADIEFIESISKIEPLQESSDIIIKFFKSEKGMLDEFLNEIDNSDIVCGWNSDYFDIPYLGKRLEILGNSYFKRLSFPSAKQPYWTDDDMLKPSGRISTDYLVLFKNYDKVERRSYKLESISDEILPNLPKLKYSGSLADLYINDFQWFIRYNIRDTEILHGFEKKLGYINIANMMAHTSTSRWDSVLGTIIMAENELINYCHYSLNNTVVDDRTDNGDVSDRIQGAYVVPPKVGMHKYIGSVDIRSLYPNVIISLNMSPETLIGQFTNADSDFEKLKNRTDDILELEIGGKVLRQPAHKWSDILRNNNFSVSARGVVFDQSTVGVIPALLMSWRSIRVKHQGIYSNLENKLSDKTLTESEYNELSESIEKHDKFQHIYKLKLNSLYGALAEIRFRYFDHRLAESTTKTGRDILKHQCAKTNELLSGVYDMMGDSVIYGDTDSTYFLTGCGNIDDAISKATMVADELNATYSKFMMDTFLCNFENSKNIKCAQEIVSKCGIFVKKKNYIMLVNYMNGKYADKLKVMGLATKKSILPKDIADTLNSFIKRILNGESWVKVSKDIVDLKEKLTTGDNILRIGLPKGVNGVEQYTEKYNIDDDAKLPGHVAAAIFYNKMLVDHNDLVSPKITSGMKIKVFYTTKMHGRFKSIALPTDIETIPQWFKDNIDVEIDSHITRLVDMPLDTILKAINLKSPSRQSMYVDSLLEFN